MLFLNQCVLMNKLDQILLATPKFAISDALQDNINSYSHAVLLSTKLSAYKGVIPRDHVLNILIKNNLHIPDNLAKDQHASNLLKNAVKEALTQKRAQIKKDVKSSIKAKQTIYQLATASVSGTRCTVTAQLCSRLALLRKLHLEDSGGKFWDNVDDRLVMVREKAKNDVKKIDKALKDYLKKDRVLYRSDEVAVPTDVESWQEIVDDEVAGLSVTEAGMTA
ncbi:hypothetical protein B0H34DRAFT_105306 [Crassisporium funariophilum]|nr:hypothetical protein B0H34DRAFT_104009 [Crassisporium funariophilum]KAF8153429.1 hypothetical protein B0H34DRAFT_105306 [Crassisporium funariophilum]